MHPFDNDQDISESQQEELLDDLEIRCQIDVAALREADTLQVRPRVAVRTGNVSLRHELLVELQTGELTPHSLTGIAPRPLMVGDVFHLQFDGRELDIPPTLAICDRCAMLGDESFELRFRFTQAIQLKGA